MDNNSTALRRIRSKRIPCDMEDERIDEWLYSLEPVTLKVVCALVDYVYRDIRKRILECGGVKAKQLEAIEIGIDHRYQFL